MAPNGYSQLSALGYGFGGSAAPRTFKREDFLMSGGESIWSTVLLMVLAGAALYFLMIRPQQKRQKEQQSHMSALEPGARVMLISGIIATVKYLGDKQAVVEISPGVEMTVDKRAISSQPVADEFEYADDEAGADEPAELAVGEAEPVEPAAEPVEPVVVDLEPAADAADAPEPTWDNPAAPKN